MAFTILTPNMNLSVPIVGQEAGPQYATDINSCLTLIDQHNHTSGSGVQIPPAGLNINSDLTFSGNNATNLRSSRYNSQILPLALVNDINCVYVSGVDLYYNDSNSNQIRLTTSGHVNSGAGSISGLPSGTASANYNSGSGTFVFQSSTNTAANIDGGSFILRNNTASSHALTLSPPSALTSDYSITLPNLPSVLSILTIDTSGNMNATLTPDNSTIGISSNQLIVKNQGITSTQIANLTITSSQIASATITGTQMAANVNLSGAPQGNGKYLVLNYSNAVGTNLAIMRGLIAANGSINTGEGYVMSHPSTGQYTISFNAVFGDVPTAVITPNPGSATLFFAVASSISSGAIQVATFDQTFTLVDCAFSFLAVGKRN